LCSQELAVSLIEAYYNYSTLSSGAFVKMATNLDFTSDGLLEFAIDHRDQTFMYSNISSSGPWPSPLQVAGSGSERRSTSPTSIASQQQYQAIHHNSPTLLSDWALHQQQQHQLQQFMNEGALMNSFNHFPNSFTGSPINFHLPATQADIEASLRMDAPIFDGLPQQTAQTMQWAMGGGVGSGMGNGMGSGLGGGVGSGIGQGMANWQDFQQAISTYHPDGLPSSSVGRGSHSPTGTYLEVISLPSSSSDHGWSTVDAYHNFESYQQAQQANQAAVFNPGQTLHIRSHSDSSQSDGADIIGSFEDITFPSPYSPSYSPASDSFAENSHRNCYHGESPHHSQELISPSAAVAPVPIKMSSSSSRQMPAGYSSPPNRRKSITDGSAQRKSPTTKAAKPVIRRNSNGKSKDAEKKVGRRRGPLLPEQRKQASEIRKLRACLRCKFLKKTCDKGEPCAGCKPAHARLWQVPCTRIDIKDIGYFMKDWKADYERHVGRGVTVYNIKGFSQKEQIMWITHGYGFAIPIKAREVFVSDDSCFTVDWVETVRQHDEPQEFDVRTGNMSAGAEGVSTAALSEYLDKHLEGPFEDFIDNHFEGTPFITEILKTAHRYYVKEQLPIIGKALKLVLAYNLTLQVALVEQNAEENTMEGYIDDEESRFYGKVAAPVMINFQIKCALADMWRDLQRDVLEELSSLYSSVYSGERLKNWPTIFMLASILLAVWEEMQFDCHYRVPDPAAVNKFCNDMETTPVGVIVGLFHAISQKLPAFTEWDTARHGHLLNDNPAVCDAMTEMRQHVRKHGKCYLFNWRSFQLTHYLEPYLKTRSEATFDPRNFDSLSNKFLSKLVIRAN
jgi:hypothetical protein